MKAGEVAQLLLRLMENIRSVMPLRRFHKLDDNFVVVADVAVLVGHPESHSLTWPVPAELVAGPQGNHGIRTGFRRSAHLGRSHHPIPNHYGCPSDKERHNANQQPKMPPFSALLPNLFLLNPCFSFYTLGSVGDALAIGDPLLEGTAHPREPQFFKFSPALVSNGCHGCISLER